MEPSGKPLIYAELLSNIRQVSVAVSLPSPADASTKADVLQHGHQLQITHKGQVEVASLPAQVMSPPSLPIPGQGGLDLSWRLPVSPAEARPAHFSLENQAVPWTSTDVEIGSPISCWNCGQDFISKGTIKTWKDLPSDNWAEMMEFWHCHKPHDHDQPDAESLAGKGYGANNSISAQQSTGFVDLTSFLFAESDCNGLVYSSSAADAGFDMSSLALDEDTSRKFLHIFCKGCRTEVGLFNIPASSVTLFKWQIACQTLAPCPKPSSAECLAATLIATISRSGSSKSIVTPYILGPSSEPHNPRIDLHLWVLNPNVVYASSSSMKSKTALKVLYKDIDSKEATELIESLNSDVQEIALPQAAIEAVKEQLKSSELLLPPRERTFKEWNVGLLGRWERKSQRA